MEFNATFLVSIISFLAFVKIMNAMFYIPLTDIIEERKNLVDKNLNDTQKANELAEKLLQDKEEQLANAAKESRQILIDKTNEANLNFHEQVNNAKANASEQINQLKNELLASENEAKESLNSHIENLAQTIVNKVLQGGLNG